MKKILCVISALWILLVPQILTNASTVSQFVEGTEYTSVSRGDTLIVSGEDNVYEGIELVLFTDKDVYQCGEHIYITVELENVSNRVIGNIAINNIVPECFEVQDIVSEECNYLNVLKPGQKCIYTVEAIYVEKDVAPTPGVELEEKEDDIDDMQDAVEDVIEDEKGNADTELAPSTPKSSKNANEVKEEKSSSAKKEVFKKDETVVEESKVEENIVEDAIEESVEEEKITEEEIPLVETNTNVENVITEKSYSFIWWIVGFAILVVILIVALIFGKKKRIVKNLSVMLCITVTLASMNGTQIEAMAQGINDAKENVLRSVSIGDETVSAGSVSQGVPGMVLGKRIIVQKESAFVYDGLEYITSCEVTFTEGQEVISADDLSIDVNNFVYNDEHECYAFYSQLEEIGGRLENAEYYSLITLEVYSDKEILIQKMEILPSEVWNFKEVGMFPGCNRIVVTAVGLGKSTDSIVLYDAMGMNYEFLDDATKDSDEDGVYDLIEEYHGTDINNPDTDGDGLTDYQEVVETNTSPCQEDSDEDGIPDAQEDADGDGLPNGQEYEIGTGAIFVDSDFDDLLDYDEINTYYTNPCLKDTDGDGAEDAWEVINGYNPTQFDSFFRLEYSTGNEVSEVIPIVAGVELELQEGDVESLSIEPVSSYTNPLLSPSVAGYLGCAYDFTVDGSFESATMTFMYDSSLGTLSEDFQPRIYYFNQTNNTLEELPEQVVTANSVSVTVEHFSTYILLNKIEFDKVWETEIKPTDVKGQIKKGLDVVFVIDSSGSMSSNDRNNLRLSAAKAFVDKLGENDRGAVVDFDSYASVYQDFTSDHDALYKAIGRVNRSGGTNLSAGISKGISLFTSPDYVNDDVYKYIIFLTDGNGSYNTTYTTQAINNEIVIYTIGLGRGVSSSVLKQIAEATGGKYYFASAATELGDIYDEISDETVDYSADSNNDGITDYYTQLIKEGSLVLSSSSSALSGFDFNYDAQGILSDDYDGDGLKNGEEIKIVTEGNRTYIKMISNPLQVHSDGDGVTDYQEVKRGTDPLVNTLEANAGLVDILKSNDYYYCEQVVENHYDSWTSQAATNVGAFIYGVWNKDEVYRDLMIKYYCNYATNDTLEKQKVELGKKSAVEYLSSLSQGVYKHFADGAKRQSARTEINSLISMINGMTTEAEITNAFKNKISTLVLNIHNMSEEATYFRAETYGNTYVKNIKTMADMEGLSDMVGKGWTFLNKFADSMAFVGYGVDVVDTVYGLVQVAANTEAFSTNMEALDYIIDNSSDSHARDAARQLRNYLAANFGSSLLTVAEAVGADAVEITRDVVLTIASKNVYVLAVVAVRDTFDLLFNVSEDIQQTYQMLCYHEMVKAYKYLFNSSVIASADGTYYYLEQDTRYNHINYLNNLAQIRILGEVQYYQWMEYTGLLKGLMNSLIDLEETKKRVNEQLDGLQMLVEYLDLPISGNIKYNVSEY